SWLRILAARKSRIVSPRRSQTVHSWGWREIRCRASIVPTRVESPTSSHEGSLPPQCPKPGFDKNQARKAELRMKDCRAAVYGGNKVLQCHKALASDYLYRAPEFIL